MEFSGPAVSLEDLELSITRIRHMNNIPQFSPSTTSLPKFFDFAAREAVLYEVWEKSGVFAPRGEGEAFSIALPPPNANGELHLGHCFGETVIDVLGRFHRLKGERVLLIPGKDHAGIQTQVVYEKLLRKEGTDPSSLSPNELYQRCYDFCIDRSAYMRAQEKMLGLSADWNSELFTLNPKLCDVIFETFKRLWDDGLVYRGTRIVNWSVLCQTSISDVEVEYKEAEGGFWFIRYPIEVSDERPTKRIVSREVTSGEGASLVVRVDSPELYERGDVIELSDAEVSLYVIQEKRGGGELVLLPFYFIDGALVAGTTRPETMLGDTALAVHPDDPRYQRYIGATVEVPLTGRGIAVIADARVDPYFGTGVVKVTPAHDFTDFDIGQDHGLEMLQVIGKDGRMTEAAGPFAGLTTAECRQKVVEALKGQALLYRETTIVHKVPIGERGKDVIEPLLSQQWFLAVDLPGKSLKEKALELLRGGKMAIYPSRATRLIEQWLINLRDWNISRQLWWGHKIPVWYRGDEMVVSREQPTGEGWVAETDTFDTWFSSGQWPFSTALALGLFEDERSDFFPTHTMVMGRDVLFFWCCRMLLLTSYRMGDLPWKNIFFHGLVLDEHGQKMSKSKGNGIEPKELINKFGTDALRIALLLGTTSGNDLRLSEKKVDGYSKFINKLWNTAKLIEMKVGSAPISVPSTLTLSSSLWIMEETKRCHSEVTELLERYELSMAGERLYGFVWGEYCDWYLEMIKVLLDEGSPTQREEVRYVAVETFEKLLTMLHPFAPFITEEIYQTLPCFHGRGLLAQGTWQWHLAEGLEPQHFIDLLKETVSAVRSVKSALNLSHKTIPLAPPEEWEPEVSTLIRGLARVEIVEESTIEPGRALRKPTSRGTITLEVDGKENYRSRLEKELKRLSEQERLIEKKLSGSFATQAKADLVEAERRKLEEVGGQLSTLRAELDCL